jgi:hypothetical protein
MKEIRRKAEGMAKDKVATSLPVIFDEYCTN